MPNDRPRQMLLLEQLYKEMSEGRVDDEWAEEFIENNYHRMKNGGSLSSKQIEKLEELSDRY